MTAVGFEPTPLRNGALSHRLRPLTRIVWKFLFVGPGQPEASPPPLSQIAGSICCDPHDVGSSGIVSLFAFLGPGRKAKFTIFLFPAPFALENSWGIYSTLREGVTS